MVLRAIALVSVLLLTCLSLSFTVQAQTPVAAISVVCNEMMEIDVQTGGSHSSNVTCEVENPTAYVEKIEITIDSGEFAHSAPGTMYIAPGSSETFDVRIQADQGTSVQSRTVVVNVQVTEMSGLPPPNLAESEAKFTLKILQYFGCSIGNQNSFTEVEVGMEFELAFVIYNLGNGGDIMDLALSEASTSLLDEIGFAYSFPLETIQMEEQNEPVRVVLNLKAPSDLGNSKNVEGNRISDIEVEVQVTSRNSCNSETGCESDSSAVLVDLLGNEEESEAVFVSMSGDSGNQLLLFGGGFAAGGILLSLIFAFFKKS